MRIFSESNPNQINALLRTIRPQADGVDTEDRPRPGMGPLVLSARMTVENTFRSAIFIGARNPLYIGGDLPDGMSSMLLVPVAVGELPAETSAEKARARSILNALSFGVWQAFPQAVAYRYTASGRVALYVAANEAGAQRIHEQYVVADFDGEGFPTLIGTYATRAEADAAFDAGPQVV